MIPFFTDLMSSVRENRNTKYWAEFNRGYEQTAKALQDGAVIVFIEPGAYDDGAKCAMEEWKYRCPTPPDILQGTTLTTL